MSLKILILEPDVAMAKVYKLYLEQRKHQVSVCQTSQQAIDAIDKALPDVIVMETQLAGHNGYEFLYELRSYPDWQNVAVIIHSVVPRQGFYAKAPAATELGVKDYLYKPTCSLAKLLYSVEHFALVSK